MPLLDIHVIKKKHTIKITLTATGGAMGEEVGESTVYSIGLLPPQKHKEGDVHENAQT